jgi:hypothetical protein
MTSARAARLALALATLAARPAVATAPCAGGAPGAGALDPFRAPAPKAIELNAAGKAPYRQGKWEEARKQYRAALDAEPEFLAPRLNIACSFVREERFADATREAVALLDRAYVPWAREILEAADMGALKVRPEWKEIERAMSAAAAKWGDGLGASVLFVARQRPPLHVPDGPGVFILNPHQEAWAYAPTSCRYRQLTNEDGHVVALAPSMDRRELLVVTAEKLVRGARADEVALRGVSARVLTLATMSLGARIPIDGDVRRLAIHDREIAVKSFRQGGQDVVRPLFTLELTTSVATGPRRFRVVGAALVPAKASLGLRKPAVVLTGRGVEGEGTPDARIHVPEGARSHGFPLP